MYPKYFYLLLIWGLSYRFKLIEQCNLIYIVCFVLSLNRTHAKLEDEIVIA